MVNKPASSARPRKASSSSSLWLGNSHCGLGSAQPLSASARFTVVAKSSMPIMVPFAAARAGVCVSCTLWQPQLRGLVAAPCMAMVLVWGFAIAAAGEDSVRVRF